MSRVKHGLLLLHLSHQKSIYPILHKVGKMVEKKLYIDLLQSYTNLNTNNVVKNDYFRLLSSVYSRPRDVCKHLDLQVLLPSSTNELNSIKRDLSTPIELIFIADATEIAKSNFESLLKKAFNQQGDFQFQYIDTKPINSDEQHPFDDRQYHFDFTKQFDGVVIGGTFDRIHDGHKLLIQTALLLADKKFTVGVADGPLLEKKILKELIEPVDVRINNVVKLIEETKPGISHKVVPIYDPCGPSGTDEDLQLLLVSDETIRGGPIVNEMRTRNNLPNLEVMKIVLVGESASDLAESLNAEGKLSSSAERVRLLGKPLRSPNKPKQETACYVIGMAGGIASGKSSVAKRLERLGAYTVDCDKLGHKAYEPGQAAYQRVVEEFGKQILNEDGSIDRKKLGPVVFGNKSKLELLNAIVWPEIHQMKQDIIQKVSEEGKYNVVVFEGAVLFEAGWDKEANEIWCCVIPKEEAIKRIVERNGLTDEAAIKRINSQMSNDERVGRSHVVLSTLWEPEFTQKQCEKAWFLLHERLGIPLSHQSVL